MCPYCNYSSHNPVRIQAHVVSAHSQPPVSLGAGQIQANQTQSPRLACPLCQEGCGDRAGLEHHLVTVHNVRQEGLRCLLQMVEYKTTGMPAEVPPPMLPPSPVPHPPSSPRGGQGMGQSVFPNSTSSPPEQPLPVSTPVPMAVIPCSSSGGVITPINITPQPATPTSSPKTPATSPPPVLNNSLSDDTSDPVDLNAELIENQALKLAEEGNLHNIDVYCSRHSVILLTPV